MASIEDFHNYLKCYERRLGVDVVDMEILDHYRDHLASQHSVSTVNNRLSGISRFYKHLIAEHLIKHNPADKTERESLQRKGKTPLIPEKDARKVLDSIDTSDVVGLRNRAILGMLALTGLRVGAIAKITLGAFEYDGDKPRRSRMSTEEPRE